MSVVLFVKSRTSPSLEFFRPPFGWGPPAVSSALGPASSGGGGPGALGALPGGAFARPSVWVGGGAVLSLSLPPSLSQPSACRLPSGAGHWSHEHMTAS